MKRSKIVRALCVVLCAALFLGTFAAAYSAQEPEESEAQAVLLEETTQAVEGPAEPETASVALAGDKPAATQATGINGVVDWFFRTFGFLGYVFSPTDQYFYNQRPAFQWLGGFNELYDTFAFIANVYADTMRCKFVYEGKEWNIQFWKGGYAVCLATGGEIGVYTRPLDRYVAHYDSAAVGDWLNISMSIYRRGSRLFTHPMSEDGQNDPAGETAKNKKTWWKTGYKLQLCTDFLGKPRGDEVMDATIELKTPDMAKAFIGALKGNGFTDKTPVAPPEDPCECTGCECADCSDCEGTCACSACIPVVAPAPGLQAAAATGETADLQAAITSDANYHLVGIDKPESFVLLTDNKSVRLIWRFRSEGWY